MFHGSYRENDVMFLLKKIDMDETDLLNKEEMIQSGKKHYSEMISKEYAPSKRYLEVFYQSLENNKVKMAKHIIQLAKIISSKENPVIVSLARAGTPVGVLLKHTLNKFLGINIQHYSISIIRDRGIDENALKYILKNNDGSGKNIVFIDGWTGKGVISKELKNSVGIFNNKYGTNISNDLYVLADISGKASFAATSEDYLIPSAVLNSTISGLVSRTILNDEFIGETDFHGCKYYSELQPYDLSLWFVEQIMYEINKIGIDSFTTIEYINKEELEKTSNSFISEYMKKYDVRNINYIKPGIGETTRVLLRRVPDKILVRDLSSSEVKHILVLASEKNVVVEEVKNMPYKAVGIISVLER